MSHLLIKVRTAFDLGVINILQVIYYRLSVIIGLNPVRRLEADAVSGPFFVNAQISGKDAPTNDEWRDYGKIFSFWPVPLGDGPPDWLSNPLDSRRFPGESLPWWKISDFDPRIGDIKLFWELSRFDWVLPLAQRACAGDSKSISQLNNWLNDWCVRNPPYLGPNWKCGQESSIRVMHLAVAALILGQISRSVPSLRALVRIHLARIAPTLRYAIAQDNNHGTSEAAALFIGGSWLAIFDNHSGKSWSLIGRSWLENRVERLVGEEGSFSQYSLNYHRVMLDTLCIVEVWRRALQLEPFSQKLYIRATAAAEWLRHMIDPVSGDGPNIGANDGARLLQLTNSVYRDYRPSVQLAFALFCGKRAFEAGPWDAALHWLGVGIPDLQAEPPGNLVADDGGFAVLRNSKTKAVLRFPRFRFRPSQCDALHLDFWLGGENVLRDAGTYGYNQPQKWLDYFNGTVAHNTVQFDDRDQMPRLSRFLLGDWLKTDFVSSLSKRGEFIRFGAGYTDRFGASHRRIVLLSSTCMRVTDKIRGFANRAVVRWRIMPGDLHVIIVSSYKVVVRRIQAPLFNIEVKSTVPIERAEVVEGWESRHYLQKENIPVLEIEVSNEGFLTTELRWENESSVH
jgi:hypothetical protein